MIDRYHVEPVYDVLLQRCAACGEAGLTLRLHRPLPKLRRPRLRHDWRLRVVSQFEVQI